MVPENLVVVPNISFLHIRPEITRETIFTSFSNYPGMVCIRIQYLEWVQKVSRQVVEIPNRIKHFCANKYQFYKNLGKSIRNHSMTEFQIFDLLIIVF
jgi:hypothetical protein